MSEQKIFKNTHEEIIDEELFELVQEKRGTYRPRVTKIKSVGLFSGVVCCADCGTTHRYNAQRETRSPFYFCAANKRRIKTCTSPHNIQEKVLMEKVLQNIKEVMSKLDSNETELFAFLEKRNQRTRTWTFENERLLLQKAERRDQEPDVILQRLYEDNLSGKVSDARYAKMSAQYELEQATLTQTLASLREAQEKAEEASAGIVSFIQGAKKYLNPTTLEPYMVRALIEKIEIREKTKVDYKKEQKINIIYRFVGNLAE
ncbi:MAG TPA: DUF4368 domain-containing protein [Lactovum miscens]|uniref:DUF4368 domain-containing protein n=1 Tax=Lactovum miscens TaxID=190387 RepID=UPI002ED79ECE